MSFFKKKILIIFGIIVAITIGLAALSKSGNNPLANAVNTVFTPIESKLAGVINPIDKFFSFSKNRKSIEEENARLRAENIRLRTRVKDVSEYADENERLKKLLAISYSDISYTKVYARVVSFGVDSWFSYITIDKGEQDGIKVSNTVVTQAGLVGQVVDVGKNWAKISTIVNLESSAGVRIVRNGEIGILEGDAKLSRKNKCKLGYLNADTSVNTGDILETSGLGGIYPPGLMVGKISDLRKDNMGRLDYAVIEPFIDFNKLYEVMVITDWKLLDSGKQVSQAQLEEKQIQAAKEKEQKEAQKKEEERKKAQASKDEEENEKEE